MSEQTNLRLMHIMAAGLSSKGVKPHQVCSMVAACSLRSTSPCLCKEYVTGASISQLIPCGYLLLIKEILSRTFYRLVSLLAEY